MHAVGLRGHLPVIIKSFLSNRMFKVMINGITSEEYIQYESVPQGSIFSTTLYILAINDIVYTLPRGVQCSLYVNDFAIWFSYSNKKEGQKVLQGAIDSFRDIISWVYHFKIKNCSNHIC